MPMPRTRILWVLLIAVLALAWVVVGIPAWHIQPFRPQTDRGMAWSFALRRQGPLLTGLGVVVAAMLAARLWQMSRGAGPRIAAVLVAALSLAPAWFVRQNHFEWKFAPLDQVDYTTTAEATFLTDDEMVMGVQIDDQAVAFPIRQLAYHHMVNTEVADEPVVATY
jgi:hypothetical protein